MDAEKDPTAELVEWFETHDTGEMRRLLDGVPDGSRDGGADATAQPGGRSITTLYLESYMRSPRFSEGLGLLLDRGAVLDDPGLAPVLADDEEWIARTAREDPDWLGREVSMRCTFTSLTGVSLLHLAVEYGLVGSTRALLALGADPNARAAVDEHGRGGHTPLFHAVNANADFGRDVRRLLLDAGARVDVLVAALPWGEGFEWETTFFDVTPISFCHAGLMRQVHRDERTIFGVIEELLRVAGRDVPPLPNVPNRYLAE